MAIALNEIKSRLKDLEAFGKYLPESMKPLARETYRQVKEYEGNQIPQKLAIQLIKDAAAAAACFKLSNPQVPLI